MGKQVEVTLKTGKVVGHIVRYLPKKEEQLEAGVTITRQHKVAAFVQLFVDRRMYTVQCQESTKLLEMDEHPTNEHRLATFNAVLDQHPAESERTFRELTRPNNKKFKRYEFEREGNKRHDPPTPKTDDELDTVNGNV